MLDPKTVANIRSIIRNRLPDPAYEIFVFGSRAEGDNHRKFSDVDVGILGPTPLEFMTKFSIDFSKVNPKFKDRNMASHLYDEDEMKKVFSDLPSFVSETEKIIVKLGQA